ncbi:homogentisate 1,2-dioxygenase [Mariniblastus fucicola]|uniref:Homogentisate 1,2-dioxygenase n=1 Tax=Mariniblastus fucicola TaxID=980251 RepID=A0A5B9PF03_9BACT|nr:homogentisate 1,2-dioxygenase [Mariniblastus fucicola]QEG23196.1 Homogentisate 1,2-dioxygenase [Mariniblastus fucicola]
MPFYRTMGSVPPKRHIKHRRSGNSHLDEGIYYEHVLTTEGFDRVYSITYHLRPPTRVVGTSLLRNVELEAAEDLPLRVHHFMSANMPRGGDFIDGRVPMMFNDDLVAYRCRPAEQQSMLFRNAAADEIIFVQQGSGKVETTYGTLPYRRGDYIVIPRTTTFQMVADDIEKEDYLILESNSPCRVPQQYLNVDGQMMLGAPYYERDLHGPTELNPVDKNETTTIIVKERHRLTKVEMANHPLDVVGWDGYLYPFTFNAWDFEPLTGTVHLPPPYQQTFECDGFVICTFAPRYLDHHPEAVKVPYAHSNTQADEVLFYVDGQFGSRKGVEACSFSFHPGGIPHGPHPGTIVGSESHDRTEEMAVMFDTDHPLTITKEAMEMDDPQYPLSWIDE